jgi:hypothetical protein
MDPTSEDFEQPAGEPVVFTFMADTEPTAEAFNALLWHLREHPDLMDEAEDLKASELNQATSERLAQGHTCFMCGQPAMTAMVVHHPEDLWSPRWLDACASCRSWLMKGSLAAEVFDGLHKVLPGGGTMQSYAIQRFDPELEDTELGGWVYVFKEPVRWYASPEAAWMIVEGLTGHRLRVVECREVTDYTTVGEERTL